MIVATAGHVDHGKTLLIKALTGVDCDRLPEEKKRGMTIDLGFAFLRAGSGESIGFVDVPGHGRFIHNMLCGLAGIDFVLFVVAADDSAMPQTREHLGILDLLEVSRGAVAITKIDRVSPARLGEVEAEIAGLFTGTSLASAPIYRVSATAGTGIENLKQHLLQAARDLPINPAQGKFRLAVDRCFNVAGAGLVVTGTAVSGCVDAGAQVRALLADIPLRVRGIHAQNAPSKSGRAGQRCALNLAGADLGREKIVRGDWIVEGNTPPPARKIDVLLRVASSGEQSLKHWTPVHVHLGAADVTGRIALLEALEIAAGETGLAQLVLDRPIGAWHGDRFIVRDQSAQRTIGGGRVIDVFPPARGRAKPDRLTFLRAMSSDDDEVALASLLKMSANGVELSQFALARNLTSDEARELFLRVPMRSILSPASSVGFSEYRWNKLKATALELLAAWHRRAPDSAGPNEDRIFSGSSAKLPSGVSAAIVAELVSEGAVVRQGTAVQLPTHRTTVSSADAGLWNRLAPILDRSELRPPTVRELAKAVGEDPRRVESLLVRAARRGDLIRLSENRFYRPAALQRLAAMAESLAKESNTGMLMVGAFRDRTEIGRNLTIEVLEFFDRIKFTQRSGEARRVLRAAHDVLGGNCRAQHL